jgi:hypothetical protein
MHVIIINSIHIIIINSPVLYAEESTFNITGLLKAQSLLEYRYH